MVEKIGTIKNPLTIIAIFAAIAEISGTVVLPFVAEANQEQYIWFLMIFPVLLVILFFATLNFNHRVLYAPSDFRNEDNFFKEVRFATPNQIQEKLTEQAREAEEAEKDQTEEVGTGANGEPAKPSDAIPPAPTEHTVPTPTTTQPAQALAKREAPGSRLRATLERFTLADRIAIGHIEREQNAVAVRNVRISESPYVFDGLILNENNTTAIEVLYARETKNLANRLAAMMQKITAATETLPPSMKDLKLVIAVVTEGPLLFKKQMRARLQPLTSAAPIPVTLRFFDLLDPENDSDALS